MPKKRLDLYAATDERWVMHALADFPAFLADHANCERKASAMATSLMMRYRDRKEIIPGLIALAIEELEHLQQVYDFMSEYHVDLLADEKDPYINALLKIVRHGREHEFLDRLLVCSLVETRGAERFRLVAEYFKETNNRLHEFYRDLWASEAKHGNLFIEWAEVYFPSDIVQKRLHALGKKEADIMLQQPCRHALH
ncbi:MAG: tRNA-(ms[2]io[6]A)-hydroxylase [Mariprofundales bacterium]